MRIMSDHFTFQRGASMIEVLVALTIVAFGLLGLAGLQARSVSFNKDSYDRKAAAEMAAQLAERIRANYDGFNIGSYNLTMLPAEQPPFPVPACADPQRCTAKEVADRDWAMWRADLRRRLPGAGAYLVAPALAPQLTLTLAWEEAQPNPTPDPVCAAAPVNMVDPTNKWRCFTWILHP